MSETARLGWCLHCGKHQRVDGEYRVCTDCGAALTPAIKPIEGAYRCGITIDIRPRKCDAEREE